MKSDWLERWHEKLLFLEVAVAGITAGALMEYTPLKVIGLIGLIAAILLPPERR